MALHDLGASNLRDLADYKKCGNLHEKRHGKFNKLVRGKWCPCFLIVSRISKTSPSWALFCYHDQFSTRAHHVFILRECESVDDYKSEDEPIIGFCVTFIDKQRKMLVFACPSKESKEIWMQALRSGITESHSCSADSGISSGGSLMMDPVSNTYVTESTIRKSRYGSYEDMDHLPVDTDESEPNSTNTLGYVSVRTPLPSTENTRGTQETSHIGGDDNTSVKSMAVPDEFDSNGNYENLVLKSYQKK